MKVLKIAAIVWVTLFSLLVGLYSLSTYLGGLETPDPFKVLILITTYAVVAFLVIGYALNKLFDLI